MATNAVAVMLLPSSSYRRSHVQEFANHSPLCMQDAKKLGPKISCEGILTTISLRHFDHDPLKIVQ